MMSDVLAFSKDSFHSAYGPLQSSGNPDCGNAGHCMHYFCQRKKAGRSRFQLANDSGLVVLATGHRMFSACGMLYKAGLGGGAI